MTTGIKILPPPPPLFPFTHVCLCFLLLLLLNPFPDCFFFLFFLENRVTAKSQLSYIDAHIFRKSKNEVINSAGL